MESWPEDNVDSFESSPFWELEEDWVAPKNKGQLGSVKNTDYNLNNPLLSDGLTAFCRYLKGKSFDKIFHLHRWISTKALMEESKIRVEGNPEALHHWMGEYFLNQDIPLSRFKPLWDLVIKHSRLTHIVPELFVRSLGRYHLPYLERGERNWEKLYLTKFMEWHLLVIVMNHFEDDLSSIAPLINLKKKSSAHGICYSARVSGVGEVLVFDWILVLPNGLILNKNFVLMIKDTLLARFQTLITMYPRHDGKFTLEDVRTLLKVYSLGDRMLYTIGNEAYDLLKFVEPICNLRMTQLANKHRPLIPEFPNFRQYLEAELPELCKLSPIIMELWDTITSLDDPELVVQIFGCFRHWGHPFIDYGEGLQKLYEQVTMPKIIDDELAQALGSDLAYLVLRSQFKKTKKWFVDPSKLPMNHPLKKFVETSTWPTPKVIEDFGDKWHTLPLTQCFDIPDLVDPALIYSDKSHSVNRRSLIQHVSSGAYSKFPTKRVLTTFLTEPARDWKSFLQQINDRGLPDDALCIGLRPKERELKRAGRFFALMSWELREYFVFTEYLIKEHFIPLFKGLTMADDMTGVIKKLLECSNGHGETDYSNITISNHLDYSKWNNHQRYESNKYVFQVMGSFLGYPNLISRTHEFFQKSLIYFINRPDLMVVKGNTLEPKGQMRVCWNGQAGGLEGLRQKGWSIVNLLLIMRVGKLRNTEIKILAQGDNQVMNSHYKLPAYRTDFELLECISEIIRNNKYIMQEVDHWTQRLGLIINKDETMQSADFLIYGKVPIFRGNITIPESKKWSRVNCVTNDQLPTFGNVMSTVSSTALSVSHFSNSFLDPIEFYNLLGNFSRILLEMFNPVLNKSLLQFFTDWSQFEDVGYLISVLYLDPSLGGVCGMSLSRFLIRAFPDPVTEGLSFWRRLSTVTSDPNLRKLFLSFGNPPLGRFKMEDLTKLMEKPESLNIPSSLSAQILIRTEIREILRRNVRVIKNEIIVNAISYGMQAEEHLIRFLYSIKPLFPRFLAEFKSSTYLGLTESLVGLYENSKTIRNRFLGQREREIDDLVQRSEYVGIKYLVQVRKERTTPGPWNCSASHADRLRRLSWGQPVIGATIPHPFEMLGKVCYLFRGSGCECPDSSNYTTTFVNWDAESVMSRKGPFLPYLGSKTSESTSLINPWERETIIPLIKRAAKLRNAINWFVRSDSLLARSILNNLRALTGEDPGQGNPGFFRTGSALHRFACSRQSSGGFSALSPAYLSRFLTTTDTLQGIGDRNYDFMFQSLILYSQSSLCVQINRNVQGIVHHHISCNECLREITEPFLEGSFEYKPKDVSRHVRKWIPGGNQILTEKLRLEFQYGNWEAISDAEKTYHVGRAIGFVFSDYAFSSSAQLEESSLFPLSIRNSLTPELFYEGLIDGLIRGCSIQITHRRNVALLKKPRETLVGSVFFAITKITLNTPFLSLVRVGAIHDYIIRNSHRTPPSYPLSKWDLGGILRHYLKTRFLHLLRTGYSSRYTSVWIFADLAGIEVGGLLCLSSHLLEYSVSPNKTKLGAERLRKFKEIEINMRQKTQVDLSCLDLRRVYLCKSEVRHSVKSIDKKTVQSEAPLYKFEEEEVGYVVAWDVSYLSAPALSPKEELTVPRLQCPLISGLRTIQLATGAHYKVRSILNHFNIQFDDFLCGGDGSGGLTAMCLRWNRFSRGIFNSLLDLSGYDLRGSRPSEPSAIAALGADAARCVNRQTCWQHPSDLTDKSTWNYFVDLKAEFGLTIKLMIFDMENRDEQSFLIEDQIIDYLPRLLSRSGSLIFKTYCHRLISQQNPLLLKRLGRHFKRSCLVQTEFTSNFSSEVYVVLMDYVPGNSLAGIVDYTEMTRFLGKRFVFSNPVDEFKRALGIKRKAMEKGIPSELLPDPEVELATVLEICGLESGRAASVAEICCSKSISPKVKYLFVRSITFCSFFNLTSGFSERPHVPSDSKLLRFFSFFIGLEYWWSWVSEELPRFERMNQFLREDLFITHESKKGKDFWVRKVFLGAFDIGVVKRLRLQGSLAGIGSAIRSLRRAVPLNETGLTLSVSELIGRFDRGLTPSVLSSRSNLLTYIQDYRSNLDLPVSSEIINTGIRGDMATTE
ncbi:RNA polymerase [Tupaia virus]|uniref:RNA-directed RNA polymerase L n=1 Tax=Tupaia virus (isolate Tupaia/Thailand/-/1986) TaxID=1560034 RepID=L_TUPVT|nr:RNA polymerase [Tupaia virus]Q4VKV2.1 RecName: Full=RNA-directed RNA polymerase L; Short=Protein L; AltName: Full=Large structural protein; AltName: Full=Replicase; AltName: Full=Transcriptase; Includes: RecName: Full=RNA-directed RNA polymerase; Includes: RecName: Full=GTP phosphohydrolase; Includes: RecName: Full=GDP polyribonucleotidyltransferase; AltName: Full=PRNTase; Includes: RecName: Full=mRNA cap methyltransferase; AltName: Full=mRNA (guanine-N(7)-)-methyltransferase; Short=G-N7-MTase;